MQKLDPRVVAAIETSRAQVQPVQLSALAGWEMALRAASYIMHDLGKAGGNMAFFVGAAERTLSMMIWAAQQTGEDTQKVHAWLGDIDSSLVELDGLVNRPEAPDHARSALARLQGQDPKLRRDIAFVAQSALR